LHIADSLLAHSHQIQLNIDLWATWGNMRFKLINQVNLNERLERIARRNRVPDLTPIVDWLLAHSKIARSIRRKIQEWERGNREL